MKKIQEVKRIPTGITVREYKISFSYETVSGKYREQQVTLRAIDEDMANKFFKEWCNKSRTISNAKILGIVEIGEKVSFIAL